MQSTLNSTTKGPTFQQTISMTDLCCNIHQFSNTQMNPKLALSTGTLTPKSSMHSSIIDLQKTVGPSNSVNIHTIASKKSPSKIDTVIKKNSESNNNYIRPESSQFMNNQMGMERVKSSWRNQSQYYNNQKILRSPPAQQQTNILQYQKTQEPPLQWYKNKINVLQIANKQLFHNNKNLQNQLRQLDSNLQIALMQKRKMDDQQQRRNSILKSHTQQQNERVKNMLQDKIQQLQLMTRIVEVKSEQINRLQNKLKQAKQSNIQINNELKAVQIEAIKQRIKLDMQNNLKKKLVQKISQQYQQSYVCNIQLSIDDLINQLQESLRKKIKNQIKQQSDDPIALLSSRHHLYQQHAKQIQVLETQIKLLTQQVNSLKQQLSQKGAQILNLQQTNQYCRQLYLTTKQKLQDQLNPVLRQVTSNFTMKLDSVIQQKSIQAKISSDQISEHQKFERSYLKSQVQKLKDESLLLESKIKQLQTKDCDKCRMMGKTIIKLNQQLKQLKIKQSQQYSLRINQLINSSFNCSVTNSSKFLHSGISGAFNGLN